MMPMVSHIAKTRRPKALQTSLLAACAVLAILATGVLLCAGDVACLAQGAGSGDAPVGIAADGSPTDKTNARFVLIF